MWCFVAVAVVFIGYTSRTATAFFATQQNYSGGRITECVVPVGLAWNRAIDTGLAGDNPYAGIPAGKINLWSWDSYHASAYGYYLEALLVFAKVTGRDPLSLGTHSVCSGSTHQLPFTTNLYS